jgi:hypothetical protein
VETEGGLTVRCDAHVMATNSPCNHNLAVHARQLPYRRGGERGRRPVGRKWRRSRAMVRKWPCRGEPQPA